MIRSKGGLTVEQSRVLRCVSLVPEAEVEGLVLFVSASKCTRGEQSPAKETLPPARGFRTRPPEPADILPANSSAAETYLGDLADSLTVAPLVVLLAPLVHTEHDRPASCGRFARANAP